MAVASGFVIFIVLNAVLPIPTIPTTQLWEFTVASLVSLLVSALIVGYVFASKIREESRMISIGKIVVMAGFVMMFFTMIGYAAVSSHSECDLH
jgi:VIT1/CCC1 family predicted Fe2+/Mn2+ transporter